MIERCRIGSFSKISPGFQLFGQDIPSPEPPSPAPRVRGESRTERFRLVVVGCICVTAIVLARAGHLNAATPPNIVLIVADDLGWDGVGYHGSAIRTPHLDRLAQQGVRLDRFYVSPMCSPTRAGLLTGRYPMRFGMARSVVRPWAAYGLPPQEITLPEALAAAGYRHRAIFGKWHLGHLAPQWHPLSQGFTHFYGQYNGAADYWTRIRQGEPDWHLDAEPLQETGYTTDLIADAAVRFIKRHADDGPFFCYVPFTAPHDPLQAPEAYLAQYADRNKGGGKRAADVQAFSAMVTCMDDGIGRILKALSESGIAEKTLVWFLSDNGGITRLGLNGPLRAGKLTVYEGGVRVPSAAWWPGVIEGGRKLTTPIINVDVLPTLLRAAGASRPAGAPPLDGVDVLDLLTGRARSLAERDLYFFNGQDGLEREQNAVISADDWKLVVCGPDVRRPDGFRTPKHRVELFNLREDPFEKKDLSASRPDLVEALGRKLIAFRKSEPPNPLPTMNRPPADFVPPKQWRNHPITQPAD